MALTVRKVVWGIVAVPVALLAVVIAIGIASSLNEPPAAVAIEPKHVFPPTPVAVASPPPAPVPVPVPVPVPIRPRPEDIIVFPNSNIVCLKQADLQQVLLSTARGEETKIRALVSGSEDAPCFMVSPTKRLKVLSANYPDAVDPMGVLEVVGEGITSRNGAWALAVGAEIVKARRVR